MIPPAFGVVASGASVATQYWDVTKTSPDLAISGGGNNVLTKTAGAGWRASLGFNPVSGISTFINAATWVANGNVGAGNASANLSLFLGLDANSVGLSMVDGEVYYNGGSIGNVGWTYASGNTVGAQIDLPNNRIRWNKNGGAYSAWFGFSLGATVYPAAGLFTNGDVVTTAF